MTAGPGRPAHHRAERYVVRSVSRAGAMANLESLATVIMLAVALGPVLLLLLPLELLVAARFIRQGTYLDGDALVLRGPFATRRVPRAHVHRFAVDEVRRGSSQTPSRAAVAVLHDGRRIRLPGLSSSRRAPDEPDATTRALAAATGVGLAPAGR